MNEFQEQIKKYLDDGYEKLKTLKDGSAEKKELLATMNMLNNMYNANAESQAEINAKKSKGGKAEKTLEWFKVFVPVVGSILTFGLYAVLFKEGLMFEESNSVTSATVKSLFNSILRPKM